MGAVEQGGPLRGAARHFAVSPSTMIKLMQGVRATGVRVSRPDGDGHQHGAPLRPQPVRRTSGRRPAQGHWQTATVIAGLKQSGSVAPLVLDGPMTGPALRAYVEQCLAPALEPGDVVVLDKLAAHKVVGVREVVAAAGVSILYLPPYRPDLNPIEQIRQA